MVESKKTTDTEAKGDFIGSQYFRLIGFFRKCAQDLNPILRRFIRFLALPYCYFYMVNWKECSASRLQVIKDFFYIFFRLKYFPDNYSLCRLYEKDRSEWKYYYGSIYDPYQRARLRKEVQRREYFIIFHDKYVCYQLCKAEGLPVPEQYFCIEPDNDHISLIKEKLETIPGESLIIKPVQGKGGEGVTRVFLEGSDVFFSNGESMFSEDQFKIHTRSVVQEYIRQHERLSLIAPSINTVRIVTLYTKDDTVIVVGAEMRFGVGTSFVDNVSAGGVAVGIDLEKGTLKKAAHDLGGRVYYRHPTSQISFEGFRIPFWDEVVRLAKKTQHAFSYYKMLGMDIGITPEGPVIIEINGAHDNAGLEQTFGPILKNRMVHREFQRYNLLINAMSREL